MKSRLTTLLLVLLIGGLVAAGCGDDENDDSGDSGSGAAGTTQPQSGGYGGGSSGGGDTGTDDSGGRTAQSLKISADPGGQLAWDKKALSAKAGKVTITMDNPSDLPHAVEIEGEGIEEKGETVQKGGKSVASADLKPGTYEYYCPVGGHQQAGMTGTLTVK